jgi:hypothetical protein
MSNVVSLVEYVERTRHKRKPQDRLTIVLNSIQAKIKNCIRLICELEEIDAHQREMRR